MNSCSGASPAFSIPSVIILLLVAGASSVVTAEAAIFALVFALLRLIGKLAGGVLAALVAGAPDQTQLGRQLLTPGVIGIAFALDAGQAAALGFGSTSIVTIVAMGWSLERAHRARAGAFGGAGMRRLAAMGAVVATVVLVRQIGGPDVLGTKSAALAFGFALIASVLTGDLTHRFGLPRLTGYLFFGLACGPALANLITAAMARELQVINGVALAVIGLIAGLELNLDRLLPRLTAISRFTLVTVGVMLSSLAALMWAAWPWLPILPNATGALRIGAAFTVAAVVATSSPIVVISVIADSRARGRLAELTLATTVLANLLLVAVFAVALEGVRWSSGAAEPGLRVVAVAVWAVTGSLAFGALVGAIFALYMREIGRELTIVLLAACAVLGVVSRALALEPILASIAAGFVVTNAARPQGDALRVAIARGSLPVLVVFFAAAGASIDVGALAAGGMLAIGLVLVRLGLLRLGTQLGARVAGLDGTLRDAAWTGFISQAGISLGLAAAAASEFPDWGTRLQTLTVAIVAVHELVGPIAFKAALSRLGEIGPAVRRSLIVVSNREPYSHTYREDGRSTVRRRRAVSPWPSTRSCASAAACGSRTAAATPIAPSSTRTITCAVPPDRPIYTLRRVWLTHRRSRALLRRVLERARCGRCATSSTCARASAPTTGSAIAR